MKDKELCTTIGAGAGSRMGPGIFTMTCSVRPGKNIKEAEAAIEEEMQPDADDGR